MRWAADSFASYLASSAVSGSDIATFLDETPADYRHEKDNPSAGEEHHNVGTLAHAAILEAEKFRDNILLFPRSKKRVTDWAGIKETKCKIKAGGECCFCPLPIAYDEMNLVKSPNRCHVECASKAPKDEWRDALQAHADKFVLPWVELDKNRATAWQHTLEDWFLVSEAEKDAIDGMRAALLNYEVHDGHSALDFLSSGINEVSGYGRLGLTEVRIRPDSRHPDGYHDMGSFWSPDVPRRIIPDLKTTRSAKPWYWENEIKKWGYGYRSCLYPDLADHIDGCVLDDNNYIYIWVVVEKTPPYKVCIHEAHPYRRVQLWREQVMDGLEELARCGNRDEWPTWPQGVHPVGDE